MFCLQLIVGSTGGDIKVWDTSGMELTPIVALTVHGHITSLTMSAAPPPQPVLIRTGGSADSSQQRLVATSSDGDVISWVIDLVKGSAEVRGVGMVSVATGTVLQADMVHGANAPGARHRS